MGVSLEIPWYRYALIADLAERLQGRRYQFGKTALQKMVYLLQEVFHIDCGYDFELYAYGPYTPQLLQDLDLVEHIGAVVVHPMASMTGGYEICPGENIDLLREKGSEFLHRTDVSEAITNLVAEFGQCSTKDLELRSTIIYVYRDLREGNTLPPKDTVISTVKQIKPRFTESEIRSTADELTEENHIELA